MAENESRVVELQLASMFDDIGEKLSAGGLPIPFLVTILDAHGRCWFVEFDTWSHGGKISGHVSSTEEPTRVPIYPLKCYALSSNKEIATGIVEDRKFIQH